ncbi:MAG: hypothetical protein WA376_11710 [Terrimicrobiaceae bacterium]
MVHGNQTSLFEGARDVDTALRYCANRSEQGGNLSGCIARDLEANLRAPNWKNQAVTGG